MASHDAEASSQRSSEKSRRTLAGFRQLSDEAKGFFKDQVAKAKHVRDDLRYRKGEPSTPSREVAQSPSEASPLISPPTTPSPPSSTPWSPRLSWTSKALPPRPTPGEKDVPRQPTPALSSSKPQLHHLSAVRVGLTSLVILHHTAIPYGGLGSWGWHSPSFPGTSLPLAAFNAVNQTWFMAGFFWMAGYFTHMHLRKVVQPQDPNSLKGRDPDRRRIAPFMAGRATRLVVPAIAYTLLATPLARAMILASEKGTATTLIDVKTVAEASLKSLRGLKGPVWFGAVLFLLDAAAATIAKLKPSTFQQWPTWSSSKRKYVLGALTSSAAAAFFIRLPFPVGAVFAPLNLQPAFLPQYIFSYAMGHVCAATGSMYLYSLYPYAREKPFTSLAISIATMALGLGATCASIFAGEGRAKFISTGWERLTGGFTLPAALYALWNELGFVTILPSVVALCERYFNRPEVFTLILPRMPGRQAGERKKVELARYAYATFLVHPVVSFAVELLAERFVMRSIDVPQLSRSHSWLAFCGPVLATAIIGTVNVVASWAAGIAMVEWLPIVGRWI
jgi:glucans biosynthesis protein C